VVKIGERRWGLACCLGASYKCIAVQTFDVLLHHAGKLCVEASPNSKVAWISEELCIGCGICVKVSAMYNDASRPKHGLARPDGCCCLRRNALSMPS